MSEGKWTNDRRETAYSVARAVVEAQNETLGDIDEKAVKTVRLNAVLVGLLIGAVEYAPGIFQNPALYAAFGALVGSTLVGIATYDESDLYLGPRGGYIEDLVIDETDKEWDTDLLLVYSGIICENYEDVKRNGRYLRISLLFLGVAVVSAVLSVLI